MASQSYSSNPLWRRTTHESFHTAELDSEIVADVAIVGAGYTGSATALALARAGRDVTVIESLTPGAGASGCNAAGFAGIWPGVLPSGLTQAFGDLYSARMNAALAGGAAYLQELIREYSMNVDLNVCGIVIAAHRPEALPSLQLIAQEWSALGNPIRTIDADELAARAGTTRFTGGIFLEQAGTLNPFALAQAVARSAVQHGARLFCDSAVERLERAVGGWRLYTARGCVRARSVVLATNTGTPALLPAMQQSFYRVPLALVASAPLQGEHAERIIPSGIGLADSNSNNLFWIMRDAQNRLVGSLPPPLRNRNNPTKVAAPLERRLTQLYPRIPPLQWETTWLGYVDLVPDRLPRILRLDENLYAPVGFSGQGIVNAIVLGRELGAALADGNVECGSFPVQSPCRLPFSRTLPVLLQSCAFPMQRIFNEWVTR